MVTYGQIASALGNPRACRAVGNILHNNPDPVGTPCFRAVNNKKLLAKHLGMG